MLLKSLYLIYRGIYLLFADIKIIADLTQSCELFFSYIILHNSPNSASLFRPHAK